MITTPSFHYADSSVLSRVFVISQTLVMLVCHEGLTCVHHNDFRLCVSLARAIHCAKESFPCRERHVSDPESRRWAQRLDVYRLGRRTASGGRSAARFPGNEKNLDLAQDIRRTGWNVLYFNYRGSWGTLGNFSFGNSIEDVASAVAYLRQPENAKRLRLDPKRIVLIGHSMGGFMAVEAGAADSAIMGVGLISAADMPGRVPETLSQADEPAFINRYAAALANEGMAPLAGCTPEGLVRELIANAGRWRFAANVDALKTRPTQVLTSDDGLTSMGDAFVSALTKAGNTHVTAAHFATDRITTNDLSSPTPSANG